MREIEFRNWLEKQGVKAKVQSDCVSRLKRIEREFDNCDLDDVYANDKFVFLMDAFLNTGKNENMDKYPDANFPIGKYYISTFRNALKKYVTFCDAITR